MNELILKIDAFKQQIAYSITNADLPADIEQYILSDFVEALRKQAQIQLYEAQHPVKEEETEDGNSNSES